MDLNEGIIRFSIDLDNHIERAYEIIIGYMKKVNLI
jgi:hypothetical protein